MPDVEFERPDCASHSSVGRLCKCRYSWLSSLLT